MNKRRQKVFVAGWVALVLTGCAGPSHRPADSSSRAGATSTGDALPPAAEPQSAPAQHNPLAGRIVAVGQAPEGVVVDTVTRTVAVATRHPDQLVLINADTVTVTARTPLPGAVRHVELASPGGPLLVPVETAGALVRVDLPRGIASPPVVTGTSPHDAAAAANGTVFVSNELGGTVAAVRGDNVVKVFTGSVQPAGMAAVANTVGMLDARVNDLTTYDAAGLRVVGSAPAGAGPTHLTVDRHGRMIAADTRGDAVRVFALLPTPQQVGSVAQPGGPYGIAYDPVRDRLWVASSGTNEVIGYDMAGSDPREIQRFPTVQNPYSLGVDAKTGRLYVAGVTGGVLQILDTAS
ncbi:MAG TPA: YncE family protein [Mycobacterium sp.]|nr:YncE family protein [Mycobacterium sp.]